MPVLFTVLIVFAAISIAIVIIGFSLPRVAKLKREIIIETSPEKVFEQVNNYKNFVNNWSPWTAKDSNAKHNYNNIESGIGALYYWEGNKKTVGKGSMELLESETNKKVKSLLKFEGRGESYITIYISPVDTNKVKVLWNFEADNGYNPIARIFGKFMDKFLGPDYEEGLNKLKTYCEN